MKKPARWEVALMIVAFVVMMVALGWRRSQAERDQLHHREAMERIEDARLGVAAAIPVAKWLNAHLDSHNLAVLDFISGDANVQKNSALLLEQDWQPLDAARLVEALACSDSVEVRERLIALLSKQTGQEFADNLNDWESWIKKQKIVPSKADAASYLAFKALLYHRLDPRLVHHFAIGKLSSAVPHEIYWAGPKYFSAPLRHPQLLSAAQASYLSPNDLVFGIVDKNGAAIALPLRIVHWHNVVETELGGAVVTAVYDEEKKGMMAYESVDNGLNRRFFNSAFLCGGEHLIADEQTHSLWSARSGRPIVYDQTLQGAQLKALPVVATTWAVWVKEHPATKVLPVETGFDRDYRSR
jgi:hypothetical protein